MSFNLGYISTDIKEFNKALQDPNARVVCGDKCLGTPLKLDQTSRLEKLRTAIVAHEALSEISPENKEKFREVLKQLKADYERSVSQGSNKESGKC